MSRAAGRDTAGRDIEGSSVFKDRRDAGRQLADRLVRFTVLEPVVIAMPRGGVPVAGEVADRLSAPLDIIVVRKIGCPWQPELGIGAIAEGGVRVVNDGLVRDLAVRPDQLDEATIRETRELERRVIQYRGGRAAIPLANRVVILVDDGLATGYTARAAIAALRKAGASRVILAVPVAPQESIDALQDVADEVVVVETPARFFGVGQAYRAFAQTSDEAVMAVLEGAARPGPVPRRALPDDRRTP